MNGLELHTGCEDARVACDDCQSIISEALGLPSCVFRMLKAYILRVEQGEKYKYEFE